MNITYNLDFDIAGIIILSIVCIIFRTNYTIETKSNRLFLGFSLTALVSGILDITTALTITYASSVPVFINMFLNSLYLLSAVGATYIALEYILECVQYKSQSLKIINYIVLIAYLLLLIFNGFTGILFHFENDIYQHGPIYYLNFGTPIYFLVLIITFIIIKRECFTKKQLILNCSVVIFPFIFTAMQVFYAEYLLTFFSYAISVTVMLFSFETPDFVELKESRNELEQEILKQTAAALEKQHKIEMMSIEITKAIAQIVDERDESTHGHSLRVSAYSVLLAQSLGWEPEKVETLRLAALLHDVGKISIPDAIIQKPYKLSDDEFEIVKLHTTNVGRILHNLSTLPNAEVVAMYHHERYDGEGYPGIFQGKEIPDFARVVAIADAYDAMMSVRAYRDKMPKEKVIETMKNNRGKQFDPDYLDVFLNLINCGIIS